MKKLKINTGTAVLLKNPPESFSEYESIHINTGNALISRKVYDILMGMGVSINSGNTNIIDAEGDITELPGRTIITANSLYKGCFLMCEGDIIIESAKGLDGITGLYAKCIFHPESVDLSAVKGVVSSNKVAYATDAKLCIGDMTLNEDSYITLNDDTLYWIHGTIKALDENALVKIQQKNITFHCKGLTIYNGLYEKYRDMFQANEVQTIPDGYGVSWELSLDAGTSLIYGEKLYLLGDMMIPHNQTEHLRGFSSLIVKGTVTMPVSAVASFKSVGKADNYDLYEGVLREGNGRTIINHDMLKTAIEQSIIYTIRANGELIFTDDVTVQDIDAISAVECKGKLIVSGNVRGALDSKIKDMNGVIGSADEIDKETEKEVGVNTINTGNFKF
jgi:hypothetical protein